MKLTAAASLLASLTLAPVLSALAAEHGHDMQQMGQGMAQGQHMQMSWSDGTVKKINADTGKVTISHGPLPNLDMPPMTMLFKVKDPAWLNQMKPGDRIRFVAERVNGALTVTGLERSR